MNKFRIAPTKRFKKDLKKYIHRKGDRQAISKVIDLLARNGNEAIPQKMKPHKLSGKFSRYWECHIKPDLLIIWDETEIPEPTIRLVRIGSHSNLF